MGLFNSILGGATGGPWGWMPPGIGGGPMVPQDRFQVQPKAPPGGGSKQGGQRRGRGGLFGSGVSAQELFENLAAARAIAQGDVGPYVQMNAHRQRLMAEQQQAQAEMEAEQRAREEQIWGLKQSGVPNEVIASMSPQDASQLLYQQQMPRQFGAEGGSLYMPGAPGQPGQFMNAPRTYSDNGRLYQIMPDGSSREVLDARENDINWQTGQWGAFATDRAGRPIAPGTNIQSPMGRPGAGPAQQQPPIAQPSAALDPDSIFGRMIQQESGGNQFDRNGRPLRSRAGAIGVAQIMPGTGPEAAALAGLPWDAQRLRTDPQYNAALGRAYYQQQLNEFGDPVLAAAAYNAGPNRIRNALRRGGANWQAHIPQETRDYVRSVFGEGASGAQFAQAVAVPTPGQGRSVQEQAASGMVTAPQQAPPGMAWTPDGGLVPIRGSEQERQRDREERQDMGQVLSRFRADPEIRQFREARIATQQLQRLGRTGSPASDLAIVFQFMRAVEPGGIVREGEQANVRNAAPAVQRIGNYYNMMLEGTSLTPNQRADLVRTAGGLYLERARSYNEHVEGYREEMRMLGIPEPDIGRLMPQALGPQREDQRQRQQQDPQAIVDAAQRNIRQMFPGSPVPGVRIIRRRRR